MKKAIPLILLAAGAAYYISQFKQFSAGIKAKLTGIKFNLTESQRTVFTKIIVDAVAVITNTSNVQGIIQVMNMTVMVNDKIVGSVSQFGSVPLRANGDTPIPIKISINTLSVVPTIANLISMIGKGMMQTLHVRGDIRTNVGVVNIDEKITVKI